MSDETVLFRYVMNVWWSLAVHRAGIHPKEAQYEDDFGRTALHMACIPDPPAEVVTSLVAAFPGATSKQNKWGCTPLHFACLYSKQEVVQMLIQANADAVNVRNEDNSTPLMHLCKWYHYIMKRAIHRMAFPEVSMHSILENDQELARIWENATLLLKAAYHGSVENPLPCGEKWRPLHACAGIQQCPVILLELVLKMHPEQLLEFDENGNLPLHVAASRKSSPLTASSASDDKMGNQSENLLEFLLSACPQAAQVENARGLLPLHLALQNGRPWAEGGCQALFEAFPGAVTQVDIHHKMLPFMIAAVGNEASADAIFQLLRACPEWGRLESPFLQGNAMDE